jgi:predicted ABC-type ATPase
MSQGIERPGIEPPGVDKRRAEKPGGLRGQEHIQTGISRQISNASLESVRRSVGLEGLLPSERPTVYAMAGIPASGKSHFVQLARRDGRFPDSAFILNPDLVMTALDEYQLDLTTQGPEVAFTTWELPAREITYELMQGAVDMRCDVIKDMSCAREENYRMLEQFKQQGYTIRMFHINVEPEVALQRLASRQAATGRHTPPALIHERHQALCGLLPRYRRLVDEFLAYDNNDLGQPFRPLN